MVASPELLFLQLACRLDIQRLILLGLQLCSHPPGNPCKAITTKQKLKTFLAKTQGNRGHRKALRAVKYIEDGSASIMESITYMLLTLPHVLGGYGLGGAVFNHEINSPSEQAKDMIRAAILERHGIEVMHLSTIQLYNKEACLDFALNLASRLGKRIQIRTKKFAQMYMLLRTLLPTAKSVTESESESDIEDL